MAAKLVRHSITNEKFGDIITNTTFYFLAPTKTYQGIETITGIKELTLDAVGQKMPVCTIEALLLSSFAERRKLRIDIVGAKAKYKMIIVAKDKATTFDKEVIGKSLFNGLVVNSYIPLGAKYS